MFHYINYIDLENNVFRYLLRRQDNVFKEKRADLF